VDKTTNVEIDGSVCAEESINNDSILSSISHLNEPGNNNNRGHNNNNNIVSSSTPIKQHDKNFVSTLYHIEKNYGSC